MMDPLLEFDGVEISYAGTPVVHDVSFSLAPGTIVALVGESGSGKSSLAKAAINLLGDGGSVTAGDVRYRSQSVLERTPEEMRALRGPEIGMVFQDCLASFSPTAKLGSQVEEALRAHDVSDETSACERMLATLSRFGIDDAARVWGSYPFELSGGMGQRVGIALALLFSPRVLLADEVTSALDVVSQRLVMEDLVAARDELGTSTLLITHNIGVARAIADEVVVLRKGAIVESGSALQVLTHPRSAYVASLVESMPRLRRGEGR